MWSDAFRLSTSSDEIVGHFLVYPLYFDLVANDEEKREIRAVVETHEEPPVAKPEGQGVGGEPGGRRDPGNEHRRSARPRLFHGPNQRPNRRCRTS